MKFTFGENWLKFHVTEERIQEATAHLLKLLPPHIVPAVHMMSFHDVGCGQGLALLAAYRLGFGVLTGIDSDENSAIAARHNCRGIKADIWRFDLFGTPAQDRYDVVHCWGVVHHTGRMHEAIRRLCALTAPGGVLVLSVYNKHWSSPFWRCVKWTFNRMPRTMQFLAVYGAVIPISLAKWAVVRKNPFKQERGMDFIRDIWDWLGGWPYEYANAEAVIREAQDCGMVLHRFKAATVPTGCNEFTFIRRREEL